MPLLVLETTGSVAQLGLVSAAAALGQTVGLASSGALADAFPTRRLLVACDLARAALLGLVAMVWWLHGPALWLLYAVAVLGAMLGNAFGVASTTWVVSLVGRDSILQANARLQTTLGLSMAIGPMIAGLVCQAVGPAAAIGIDGLSFALSAGSLLFVTSNVRETARGATQGTSFAEAARWICSATS